MLASHVSGRTVEEKTARYVRRSRSGLGLLVLLVAGGHLAAWLSGIMAHRGAGTITMKTNTALCLSLLAVALLSLGPDALGSARRWAGRVSASLAWVVGLLTLLENVFGWNSGIDQLMASEAPGAMGVVSPNRMGSPASFSVVLLATALLLLSRGRSKAVRLEQALAAAASVVGLLTTIGYLYGVEWLYGLARVSTIAWPTAISIVALGLGVLCSRPAEGLLAQVVAGDAGGTVVRRLLLPVWLLPIALGALQLAGQRAGHFDPAMGTAVVALVFVVSLTALTWLAGRQGSRAAAELGEQQELLAVTLKSIGDAVIACGADGRITFINQVGVELTGWTQEEAGTQPIETVFKVVDEVTGNPAEDIVKRVLREGRVIGLANHTALVTKTGRLTPIEDSAAPILDRSGTLAGAVVVFYDVTEKRRAQEALRESEERLRLALRSGAGGAWYFEARSHSAWWSPEMYELFGVPPGTEMSLEATLGLVHEEDRERVQKAVMAAIERRDEYRSEYRIRHASSGERWIGAQGRLLLDDHGQPLRMIGIAIDVTERKAAEQALRLSEEKFAKAFRSNASGMALTRLDDGTFIEVNDRYLETTGFARDQVVGRTTRGLNIWKHPDQRDEFVRRLRQDGMVRNSEYQFLRPDGTEWTGLVSAEVIELGDQRVIISSTADISERKVQERRVQQLSRLYAVLSKVDETIVRARDPLTLYRDVCRIVAEDGRRPLVWIGLVEGTRINPVAAAGEAADYVRDLRVETDGELGRGPTGTCVREDRPVVNDDFDINPSTAPWREAARRYGLKASAAFPLRHQGTVIGAMTLYGRTAGTFDSEQVRLLAALSADISFALDKMWQERALVDSERNLREADRRKDEFLAMLSHELRNPLAPIRSGIYILERSTPGGEQGRRAMAVIDRQVSHMTRLVDDLLDVTRISRGKIRLQPELLDLSELAQRVVEDHRAAFATNQVELHVEGADAPIPVQADRTRLAQILGNLLHNASKFTPSGGRVILAVSADTARGEAVVRVRDNGAGIAADMLPRIFDAFTQSETTLDRSKGGLGLGLALVKGLVHLHGGQVAAYSEGVGRGSEFVVRLPLAPAPAPAPEPVPRLTAGSRRVLVIEDHLDAAESLRMLLELQRHVVCVAHTGPSGLAAASTFRPDVVLCDIGLPGMDGFEVARAFRAHPVFGGIALVALSGYAHEEDVRRASAAGFDLHLAKPASPETLERILGELPVRHPTLSLL